MYCRFGFLVSHGLYFLSTVLSHPMPLICGWNLHLWQIGVGTSSICFMCKQPSQLQSPWRDPIIWSSYAYFLAWIQDPAMRSASVWSNISVSHSVSSWTLSFLFVSKFDCVLTFFGGWGGGIFCLIFLCDSSRTRVTCLLTTLYWPDILIILKFEHVFCVFLLQLVMYQIPFARVVCLVQRTMGAADVNRSCSSFFEEKACASMESACIPVHPDTMDTEPQIWTDVQVSSWFLSSIYYLCNPGELSLKFWVRRFLFNMLQR